MKKQKIKDINIDEIPCGFESYVLKIKHDYSITQFYRTMERFADKLNEYLEFEIKKITQNNKIYTMEIEGKLPPKDLKKIGRPRKFLL